MTLNELNQGYYFHDSILERIEYHHRELKMYCTFCEFMQSNYDESEYTNSDMIIVFHNAWYVVTEHFPIEGSGFLNQQLQDDVLTFFLENGSDEYGHFIIKAESVDVIRTRSYDL